MNKIADKRFTRIRKTLKSALFKELEMGSYNRATRLLKEIQEEMEKLQKQVNPAPTKKGVEAAKDKVNGQSYNCAECQDSGHIILGPNLNIFSCPHGCPIKFETFNFTCLEKWKSDMTWGASQKYQSFEEWKKENKCTCGCRKTEEAKVSFPAPPDAYSVNVVCVCQRFGILRGHGEVCSICHGTGFQGVLKCHKNGHCSWTPQNMKAFKDESK